jgi:hypothetical protein
MKEAGANTGPVKSFLGAMAGGETPLAALQSAQAPAAAAEFVATTWAVLTTTPIHCQAAAFAFSREDLIPPMFERVLNGDDPEGRLHAFRDYLERHIAVDSEQHMPMAMAMVAEICGDDHAKWDACARTVTAAIKARGRLWDGVVEAIANRPGSDEPVCATDEVVSYTNQPSGWRGRRRQRRSSLTA